MLSGALASGGAGTAGEASGARGLRLEPFTASPAAMAQIGADWTESLLASHPQGTWAPTPTRLSDRHLALLGLPPARVLAARRYPTPTLVTPEGRAIAVDMGGRGRARAKEPRAEPEPRGPTVATYGGAGWFGIRPGAWLLLISGNSVGWCSMAHVYGSPGSYKISTAGHCGKTGDTATVIAALGNRAGASGAVLLDFGRFSTSHDGGLGNDWALIDVDPAYQGLVSPTMCFWGGPRGMFTKTGATVAVTIPRRNLVPQVTVNPDPFLPQALVHYGHGAGIGTGGTPRAATTFHWGTSHFMFEGAITPGDSGSGANTLTGDTLGATLEAAGIITHIWIDALMREGIGIMGGTRATQVSGTLVDGQIVPYPVPAPGLP